MYLYREENNSTWQTRIYFFLYSKLNSVFLCWQLQVPVCSSLFQVKFKQSLQFLLDLAYITHTLLLISIANSFALGSAWSAVELLSASLLTLLRGRRQGHILRPSSVPTAGSSTLRKKRKSPTVPSSRVQSCRRAQEHCGQPSESLAHPGASGTI